MIKRKTAEGGAVGELGSDRELTGMPGKSWPRQIHVSLMNSSSGTLCEREGKSSVAELKKTPNKFPLKSTLQYQTLVAPPGVDRTSTVSHQTLRVKQVFWTGSESWGCKCYL